MSTRRKLIFSFFIALFLLFSFLYGFQEQQKQEKPLTHEVEVRLVLVDVIVTDKDGNFITDLTKDDFELYEDGIKVPINSMDLISLEKGEFVATEQKDVTRPALSSREKRLIVIFDSINTIRRELERNKSQIIERLLPLFKLGHEIMVLELTEKEGMRMLQPFTSDEELLAKAVKKATGSIWVEKSTDELRTPPVIKDEAASGQAQAKRDYEGKVKEFSAGAYKYFAGIRFEKTINSILALINTIKDYPGRKTILLISGGIPIVGSARIFDIFNLLKKRGFRNGLEILEAVIQFANAHNITFYALDPDTYIKYLANLPDFAGGSISFDPYDSIRATRKLHEQHWLNLVAQDTGGVSLKGANRFEKFYHVVKSDLTYYYELSYYPKRKEADGKHHKIQVEVKRPGIKIRFRKGYSDYSKDQKEILLFASASYNPSLFKQIPFKAQTIPFAQSKDKFILWVNLALPVKRLILKNVEGTSSKTLKLNISIRDTMDEKAFTGQINIPLNLTPSFLEYIKKTEFLGYNFRTPELKLRKDKYRAVFALYDEKTGEIGAVEQTLVNPDLKNATQPKIINAILGTLVKGVEGRIRPFAISKKEGTLQLSKYKFYPSIVNQFRQENTIGILLQLYFPQNKLEIMPQFSLFQDGKEITQLTAKVVDKVWNKKTKIWNEMFGLELNNVSPGNYLLNIKIPIANLDIILKREIEIRITP